MEAATDALHVLQAPVSSIAHAIQLAVAPVFLLTGVASMLSVLTQRLARAIDRSRSLKARNPDLHDDHDRHELVTLARRAGLINRAIGLCTVCALLICTVIVALFLSLFVALNLAKVVAVLFIGAMLCLIAALLYFVSEILLSTRNMRIAP